MTLTTIRFTEDHEWLRPEEDGTITVGITAHAAEQLGDIVFVELPDEGTTVTTDVEIVVIESVKAASEILAPLDGEIVEVNEALGDNPALASEDPMGAGWFFVIQPEDPSVLEGMMTEAAYKKLVG